MLLKNSNLANDGVYVAKYSNLLGSQVAFTPGVFLAVTDQSLASSVPNGFSSLSIDGTFLMWSPDNKGLYQLYRNAAGQPLNWRPITLNGGINIGDGYSENVKPISFVNSKYVYFFDKVNQTFTVYTSSPLKTNSAYTAGYSLNYVMRINFSVPNNTIIDATVDESDGKQTLYILHNEGVAKIVLTDYMQNLTQ